MKALFASFLFAASASAASFTGKVTSIIDPATLVVAHDGRSDLVRLSGVAVPAAGRARGDAKAFVKSFILLHLATVDLPSDGVPYRGDLRLMDGRSLREALLSEGLARWDAAGSPKASALAALEARARKGKRGLWAGGAFPATSDPAAPFPATNGRLCLKAGETSTLENLDFTATLRSLSDNRCPPSVQCIQAGSVKASFSFARDGSSSGDAVLEWDGVHSTRSEYAGLLVSFVEFIPAEAAGGQGVACADVSLE